MSSIFFNLFLFSSFYLLGNIFIKKNFINSILVGSLFYFFILWIVATISLNKEVITYVLISSFILSLTYFYHKTNSNFNLYNNKFKIYYKKYNYFFLLITLLFIIIGVGSLAPPSDYDSLNYHLSIPKRDLEFGKMLYIKNSFNEFEYFPFFNGIFNRIFLIYDLKNSSQIFNLFFLLLTSIIIYQIAGFFVKDEKIKFLSILFFLFLKNVSWEATTSYVEITLTFGYLICILNYLLYIKNNNNFNLIIFGLGSTLCLYTKFLSLVLLFPIFFLFIYEFLSKKNYQKLFYLFIPFVLYLPFQIKNFILTGNLLYPLFSDLFEKYHTIGRDLNLIWLILSPIDIFFNGTKVYDGMQIGFPYILIFTPFLFISKIHKFYKNIFFFIIFYYIIWFFFLTQQVRFLMPIFALFCIFSAVGVKNLLNIKFKKINFVIVLILLLSFLTQSSFLSAQTFKRIKVSFGIINEKTYLTESVNSEHIHYESCNYLSKNLNKNSKYLVLTNYVSFYCPQKNAIYVDIENFLLKNKYTDQVEFIKSNNIKFILHIKLFNDRANKKSAKKYIDINIKNNEIVKNWEKNDKIKIIKSFNGKSSDVYKIITY